MRITIAGQDSDLPVFAAGLTAGGAADAALLREIERLNPHVQFPRIPAGTVLLLPERAGLRDDASRGLTDEGFDAFADQMRAAVNATAVRVRGGHDALTLQRKEVSGVVRTSAMKRLIESDAQVRQLLEEGEAVSKADAVRARASIAAMEALGKDAAEALTELAKAIGRG